MPLHAYYYYLFDILFSDLPYRQWPIHLRNFEIKRQSFFQKRKRTVLLFKFMDLEPRTLVGTVLASVVRKKTPRHRMSRAIMIQNL